MTRATYEMGYYQQIGSANDFAVSLGGYLLDLEERIRIFREVSGKRR